MKSSHAVEWIAFLLVIIGGLNWGLVGFFHYNLVDVLFSAGSTIARVIYALIGLSALYMLVMSPMVKKR